MPTYRMDDGTIVKTENAVQSWKGDSNFDGNNRRDVHTNDNTHAQNLYKSRKGRYWIQHTTQWSGETERAEWIDKRAATGWLILNQDELPEDLAALESEISE